MKFKVGDVVVAVFYDEAFALEIIEVVKIHGTSPGRTDITWPQYKYVSLADTSRAPHTNSFSESSQMGRKAVKLSKATTRQKHDFIKLCFT